ncbi:MAG: (Fe-S)-binding protein [Candidatus Hodarchaeales archaeon]
MSTFSRYIVPDLKFRKKIVSLSQDNINYCYQCSSCTGICPLNLVSAFNPRELIHWGQLGLKMLPMDFEKLWRCTTCGACENVCPKEVDITEIVAAYRSYGIESGEKVPATYTTTLESFFSYGNPFGLAADARTDWAKDLDVPIANKETEVLYFVGCNASYDPRSQSIARALVKIFKHAGLNFGIMGNKEKDCGNCIYFMGETELSDHERSENESVIQEIQPAIIVTTSPHSYNIFKEKYELPKGTEVFHYVQFLDQLIKDGKLQFTQSLPETKVTFHDPCYLGRHNDVYDEPRRVLEAIPGVKLADMPNNRQLAVCCGGGGGNAWAETEVEERLSIPRLNEAVDVGASILATACYFCLQMFDDAIKVTNREQTIQTKDIAELIAEVL